MARVGPRARFLALALATLVTVFACGPGIGDGSASGQVDGAGPGDVAGSELAGVPTDDALDPFEVEVGGVRIVEELPADQEPTARPDGSTAGEPLCRKLVLVGPTFASNEIVLSVDGRQALDVLLTALTKDACDTDGRPCREEELRVYLVGHTDDQPTSVPGGNLQLSKDRARAVAAVFMEYGFMSVSADGKADAEPAPAPTPDTRTAAEVRAANRRVAIEVHCG